MLGKIFFDNGVKTDFDEWKTMDKKKNKNEYDFKIATKFWSWNFFDSEILFSKNLFFHTLKLLILQLWTTIYLI